MANEFIIKNGFHSKGDSEVTGSLTVSGSVVDFTDATAISGSTFSGSFVGDGSGLTGITASYNADALTTASAEFADITFTKGDGSTFQITTTPRQVVETVKNLESGTLVKGTPVYASGSTGNAIHVYAASASLSSRMPAAYILNQDLTSGQEGEGLLLGFINGVDTSAFSSGDVVYVGADGGYTNVKPTGSNLIQNLGKVTIVDAVNGSGVISGAGRANDVPNITAGYIWIGNSDGVATPTATSSIQNVVSSSYASTASYVENAQTASYVENAQTASFVETAQTASYVDAANIDQPFTNLTSSNLLVTGTASISLLHTTYESSSIIYSSGSTKFGDTSDDTHAFTGSISLTGSNADFTNSTGVSGSFSGSFVGDGSGLTGLPISEYWITGSSSTSSIYANIGGETDIIGDSTSSFIAGGISHSIIDSSNSSLVGGWRTYITGSSYSGIYAGVRCEISESDASVIIGGSDGIIKEGSNWGGIFSGDKNLIKDNSDYTAIVGGLFNTSSNDRKSVIVGGGHNYLLDGGPNAYNLIGGGSYNTIDNTSQGTILGGYKNRIYNTSDSFIAASSASLISEVSYSAIIGGFNITASNSNTVYVPNLVAIGSVTGSSFTGSFVGDGSGLTGIVSASYVENAQTASYVENAQTASFVETAQTASYVTTAQTASYVETAQTASFVETAQTASYVDAANIDGTITSASYALTASYVENAQTASFVETAQTASYVENAQTASFVENAQTASYVENAQTASFVTLAQTASYVENAQTASFVTTAQTASYVENAQTASYVDLVAGPNVTINQVGTSFEISSSGGGGSTDTGSLMTTASVSSNVITFTKGDASTFDITVDTGSGGSAFPFTGDAEITGSLTVSGSAGKIVDFTGVDAISGSVFSGSFVGDGSGLTGLVSSSYALTASYVENAQTASFVTTAQTASYVETAQTASYVENAQTASFVTTAQTASYVLGLNVNGPVADAVDAVSSSYASTASYVENAQTASFVETAQTASFVTTAQTASYVETAQTASFVTTAQTASYVDLVAGPNVTINQVGTSFEISSSGGGGGSTDTGSLLTTASAASNVITFTKGDASTFDVTVDTGSASGGMSDETRIFVWFSTM